MNSARLLRLLLWIEIGLLAVLIPIAAFEVLLHAGSDWEDMSMVVVYAALFMAATITCLFARSRGGSLVLAVLGVGVSLVSFTAAVGDVLDRLPYRYEKYVGVGVLGAFVLACVNLYGLVRLTGWRRWLTIATRVAAFSLAGVFAFLSMDLRHSSLADDTLTILLVLTGVGLGSTLILLWLQSLRPQQSLVTSKLVLNLTCPRCGERQDMAAGRSRCRKCRLVICVEIEEERCRACGYVLYRLTSERCPECGAAVMVEGDDQLGAQDGGASGG